MPMYVYMEAETVKDNLPGRLGYAASKPRDGVFFAGHIDVSQTCLPGRYYLETHLRRWTHLPR